MKLTDLIISYSDKMRLKNCVSDHVLLVGHGGRFNGW